MAARISQDGGHLLSEYHDCPKKSFDKHHIYTSAWNLFTPFLTANFMDFVARSDKFFFTITMRITYRHSDLFFRCELSMSINDCNFTGTPSGPEYGVLVRASSGSLSVRNSRFSGLMSKEPGPALNVKGLQVGPEKPFHHIRYHGPEVIHYSSCHRIETFLEYLEFHIPFISTLLDIFFYSVNYKRADRVLESDINVPRRTENFPLPSSEKWVTKQVG